jgi:RimJ/RimL family protein N-acetyltransferase
VSPADLDLGPLHDLQLSTPRLELRLGSRDELAALGRLAEEGIHPPDEMPFAVAWTDRIGQADFVDSVVEFHETALRDWRPEAWMLNLLVFAEGELAGSQSIGADDFSATKTVKTGSWLGRRYQRRGYGTEMRAAVLDLAFCGLGAASAISGAVVGNEASKRVSEKLGYHVTGMSTASPRGAAVPHFDLRIDRVEWRPPFSVEIRGLEACLPFFGVT